MRSKRVLIVDDHRDGAEMLECLVRAWGHETRIAYDGSGAVEVASDFPPDAVVMDINMPVMDGYQAAKLLKVAHGKVLLIAMTGAPAVETRSRAREAGFHHHYAKPIELDELKAVLESDTLEHLRPGFPLAD